LLVAETSLKKISIPHIELSRKICIGNSEGVLLDSTNPSGIMIKALDIAKKILQEGLEKTNEADFAKEFLEYWKADKRCVSILNDKGVSRRIFAYKIENTNTLKGNWTYLLADDEKEAYFWAKNISSSITLAIDSILLPLDNPLCFSLNAQYTVNQILTLLKKNTSNNSWNTFKNLLRQSKLPILIAISFPTEVEKKENRALFGVIIQIPAKRDLIKSYTAGFRNEKVNAEHQL